MASAYWAWFRADGARAAWKVRYCASCATEHLSALFATLRGADPSASVFACLSCGSSAEADSDPIYLTLYLPQKEPLELAIQLDGACAAKMRGPIVDHGERLEDRGSVVRGPSPSNPSWDALGLSPTV
jgi:hypothetical protein